MRRSLTLPLGLLCAALGVTSVGAQERPGEHQGEHHAAPAKAPPQQHQQPQRRPAPVFQGHPAGVHPHGPMVRQHQIRSMAPRVVARGHHEWSHWDHPDFARPHYYWAWGTFQNVTCVAEDSYGDQYPVTQLAGPGFALNEMTFAEDEAMDRCYSESGQDASCYLASCSHF